MGNSNGGKMLISPLHHFFFEVKWPTRQSLIATSTTFSNTLTKSEWMQINTRPTRYAAIEAQSRAFISWKGEKKEILKDDEWFSNVDGLFRVGQWLGRCSMFPHLNNNILSQQKYGRRISRGKLVALRSNAQHQRCCGMCLTWSIIDIYTQQQPPIWNDTV